MKCALTGAYCASTAMIRGKKMAKTIIVMAGFVALTPVIAAFDVPPIAAMTLSAVIVLTIQGLS